ncbi:hypothetical protein ABT237_24840 [Streptomyces sp. NPDC001581]|uniref:hypothetical protein n=1 Tax=Streptomyces sp. NPDC001581 TaxID=3154386 RepID=UPI00332861C5
MTITLPGMGGPGLRLPKPPRVWLAGTARLGLVPVSLTHLQGHFDAGVGVTVVRPSSGRGVVALF